MGSNPLSANIPLIVMSLINEIRRVCSQSKLLKDSSPLVIACSGGPDSTALCHIMAILCQEQKIDYALAHVNYHLRGAESEGDCQFVYGLSTFYGVPFYEHAIQGRSCCPHGESPQAFYRQVRFSFFQSLLQSGKAGKIALGHNLDDAIETFFLRLFTGAGLSGLKGIKLEEREVFIRPLLSTSRKQIIQFLENKGLDYREDSSNTSVRYTRNLLRHEIIPLISTKFDAPLSAMMKRTLELLRTDDDFMKNEVAKIKSTVGFIKEKNSGSISIDRVTFAALHLALQRRVLLSLLYEFEGVTVPRSNLYSHVEQIIYFIQNGREGRSYSLNPELSIRLEDKAVMIERTKSYRQSFLLRRLKVPGRLIIEELGLECEAEFLVAQDNQNIPAVFGDDRTDVYFDADSLPSLNLDLRPRRAGDIFRPFGLGGKKSVKKFFIDSRTPSFKRSRIVLVCSGDEIIWIVGHRRGAAAPLTEQTKRIVHLKVREQKKI